MPKVSGKKVKEKCDVFLSISNLLKEKKAELVKSGYALDEKKVLELEKEIEELKCKKPIFSAYELSYLLQYDMINELELPKAGECLMCQTGTISRRFDREELTWYLECNACLRRWGRQT